jgi:integrase/recombinase XerD
MRKPPVTLTGPMKNEIREFMRFRKSLGFAMRNTTYIYAEFDHYLKQHHPKVKTITRPMVVNYLATTTHLHSTSRGYRVTLLRGFCRYLYQKNPKHYVPEARLLPWGKRKLTPHIYTEPEIMTILGEIRKFKRRGPTVPEVYLTAISLFAATGLRAGELERLNLEDVDLESGVLTIQRSKFYKSRLVPISESTALALKLYLGLRMKGFPTDDPKSAFFIGFAGARITSNAMSRILRGVTRKLNFKTRQGTWPRLHDFRHTFATTTMNAIYESGNDPSAHLPILATYLGHVNLDHTQTYLHPSIGLLAKAGAKFQSFYQFDSLSGAVP